MQFPPDLPGDPVERQIGAQSVVGVLAQPVEDVAGAPPLDRLLDVGPYPLDRRHLRRLDLVDDDDMPAERRFDRLRDLALSPGEGGLRNFGKRQIGGRHRAQAERRLPDDLFRHRIEALAAGHGHGDLPGVGFGREQKLPQRALFGRAVLRLVPLIGGQDFAVGDRDPVEHVLRQDDQRGDRAVGRPRVARLVLIVEFRKLGRRRLRQFRHRTGAQAEEGGAAFLVAVPVDGIDDRGRRGLEAADALGKILRGEFGPLRVEKFRLAHLRGFEAAPVELRIEPAVHALERIHRPHGFPDHRVADQDAFVAGRLPEQGLAHEALGDDIDDAHGLRRPVIDAGAAAPVQRVQPLAEGALILAAEDLLLADRNHRFGAVEAVAEDIFHADDGEGRDQDAGENDAEPGSGAPADVLQHNRRVRLLCAGAPGRDGAAAPGLPAM